MGPKEKSKDSKEGRKPEANLEHRSKRAAGADKLEVTFETSAMKHRRSRVHKPSYPERRLSACEVAEVFACGVGGDASSEARVV